MKTWVLMLVFLLGCGLLFVSFHIKKQKVEIRKEVITEEAKTIPGNKTTATIVGGGVGAAAGVAAGVAIGGIGIALCGTGVGIPAGVVALGLATLFGGAGAVAGRYVGTDAITIPAKTKIEVIVKNAYPDWIWISLMIIAIITIILAIGLLINMYNSNKKSDSNELT